MSSVIIPRRLPLLLVTDNVLLPGSSMRIPAKSAHNMNLIKNRLLGSNSLRSTVIGVIPVMSGEEEDWGVARESEALDKELPSLHPIGTAAVVVQITGTNWPRPAYTLLVSGLCRFRVDKLVQEEPFLVAAVVQVDKLGQDSETIRANEELNALAENFREQASKLVEMLDISIPIVAKLKTMLGKVPSQHLPDICAAIIKASYAEKVQVLDAVDLTDRFKKALPLLMRQIEGLKLLQKAKKDGQREGGPRRDPQKPIKMNHIFRKLSPSDLDDDENDNEVDESVDLEQKIKAAAMPEYAHKAAMKELKRLNKMPQHMPEHALIRNYLELMVELPWSKSSKDVLDITQARRDLDADHYGMEKPKKRILEYLAVRQLKQSLKGPILCLVGPPGVGKTSIGRSVANTLGREFHRIALGGVCDQSDIRGHRRTYIGSMPGRIIQGLRTVGVNNPVFLLDEIDKLNTSLHGDPAAALLEVLDPEQNNSFVDHYINVAFDLSQVLFIATANSLTTIPPALRDRMEVIEIPGYTQEEKVLIATRHLIPKQLKEHGLTAEHLQIPAESIALIAGKYTREAGVRMLERRVAAICRAVAVRVAEGHTTAKREKLESLTSDKKEMGSHEMISGDPQELSALAHPPEMPIVVDEAVLEDILGPPMFEPETSMRLSQPGVAVGLAWTAMGGEIMYVEATRMEGEGKLVLTGQLGDVMKESANLALNWVRANTQRLHLESLRSLKKTDIHIHFPAGAVSKDGPSAGVTVVSVLVSLFSGRCVRSDTAMTGEITLRGIVLPVGGIKEKVLAAHRAGINRIILPLRNEKDLVEIPANVRKVMTFMLASCLEEVLMAAFDEGFPTITPASHL